MSRGKIFGWPAPEEEPLPVAASLQGLAGLTPSPEAFQATPAPARAKPDRTEPVGALARQRLLEQSLQDQATEYRRSGRSRVLLHGKLVFDGGALSCDCAIRDLSASGARVRLPAEIIVPRQLHMIETRRGIAFDARVIWTKGFELGLEFSGHHDLQNPSTPLLEIMRRLWIEHLAR